MGFRDLERYERNKARFEKYKAWLALSPDQRQAKFAAITDETKRSKPERILGVISPFNTEGTVKVYVNARILKEQQTGQGSATALSLRTALAGYFLPEPPANSIVINVKEFKYARLSFTAVVPGTVIKNSRITGAAYKKPDVDTVSSPFGQKTAQQTYADAIADIDSQAAFTTFKGGNNGRNRYKFTPEG